jgi:hypothetical protein
VALTDNRTQLNDCNDDTQTFSTTGSALGTNTDTGNLIESTASIEVQHSNVYDDTYTSGDSAGATFNLGAAGADSTFYIMVKDNGIDLASAAGAMVVFGDGTDRIGYTAGGSDALGLPYRRIFYGFKVDASDAAANPGTADQDHHVFAGTEANLNFSAITIVGYGSIHNAKAQGNVVNTYFDGIYYIANSTSATTGYAATVSGGTVGTPETMTDLVGDDETVGAGMFASPISGIYYIFTPTQWGDTGTGSSYFSGTDETWVYLGDNGGGRAVGANHFPMRFVGNSTGTNSFAQTRVVNINIGQRSQFYWDDANFDIIDLEGCTWIDFGTIICPGADVDKNADAQVFNNCDQLSPNGMNMSDLQFNGANNANGAMLLDTSGDSNNIVGAEFISDGTGHAIEISVAGTYDFDNFTFSGYGADGTTDAAVYISANVAVTINIQNGGDTPTVRNSGTAPTINNAVTVRVEGVAEGTAVKVVANETVGTITTGDVIVEGLANSSGVVETTTFNYEAAFNPSGLDVLIRARNQGIPTAAIADDGGVLTDETTEANSSTTDDMTLTPTTPAVGDHYYWGAPEEPTGFKINVSTASTDTGQSITWQYWNGSWTSLVSVTDGTNQFQNAGLNYVTWTQPADWATTTVNGQGPYYYLRARVAGVGGTPNQALGRWSSLDVTRYLPIPPSGNLQRTITNTGLTVTLSQAEDTISTF